MYRRRNRNYNDFYNYMNCYNNNKEIKEITEEKETRKEIKCEKEYDTNPLIVNIEELTKRNNDFRRVIWTGQHLQLTVMNIRVGESIGLEMHPNLDQFIKIEQGLGLVRMGKEKNNLNIEKRVCDGFAIFIPAGTWHNIINIGNVSIKLYSIYAPPQHSRGLVQRTKEEAEH